MTEPIQPSTEDKIDVIIGLLTIHRMYQEAASRALEINTPGNLAGATTYAGAPRRKTPEGPA